HNSRIRYALSITPAFIVEEKEQLISNYSTTDTTTKLIAGELGARNAVLVVEETISCRGGSAIVFTKRTIEVVPSRSCRELNLPSAATTFAGVWIGCNRAEFFDRVNWSVSDSSKCLARCLIICVNTVNSNISLVRP